MDGVNWQARRDAGSAASEQRPEQAERRPEREAAAPVQNGLDRPVDAAGDQQEHPRRALEVARPVISVPMRPCSTVASRATM